MKSIFFVILTLFSVIQVYAQNDRKLIREGNSLYSEKKFSDSEVNYRKALSKNPKSFEAAFNTANSLYKQGKFEDAAAMYDTLAALEGSNSNIAKAYYNLGNSYIKAQKIQEGINAYKKSLRINPSDEDTKTNLSYAYRLLKKQQEQKNQNQNKDQNKDNKDQNKNNNDQKKDQNKNQQDQQNQNQNQQKKQQKQGGQEISREAAEQMLQAIQNDEKNVQQRLQEQKNRNTQKVHVSKNW